MRRILFALMLASCTPATEPPCLCVPPAPVAEAGPPVKRPVAKPQKLAPAAETPVIQDDPPAADIGIPLATPDPFEDLVGMSYEDAHMRLGEPASREGGYFITHCIWRIGDCGTAVTFVRDRATFVLRATSVERGPSCAK
jgi:hypothetical protein